MLKKLLFAVAALIASIGLAIAAININTATEAELDSLPGVGPTKAKAIVDYRKANGNFKSIEDIKNVKGIGDKTFDDLKSQIAVSGATTVPAASTKADAKPAKSEAKSSAPKAEKVEAKASSSAAASVKKESAKEAKAASATASSASKSEAKSSAAKSEKADKKNK
ncbi:MAG TPA: helix-hairpin-helix domain-containing protein [Rhodocyclaceae bacterium]|nr:helix-hairpin-helix domain-containing protein [Rhodocyclaceae bacterium]